MTKLAFSVSSIELHFPTKAIPTKASPTKASPAKEIPTKASPEKGDFDGKL